MARPATAAEARSLLRAHHHPPLWRPGKINEVDPLVGVAPAVGQAPNSTMARTPCADDMCGVMSNLLPSSIYAVAVAIPLDADEWEITSLAGLLFFVVPCWLI